MKSIKLSLLIVTILTVAYFLLGLFTNYASNTVPRLFQKEPLLIWIVIGSLLCLVIAVQVLEKKMRTKRNVQKPRPQTGNHGGDMTSITCDVFVSYSHRDKDWVDNTLVPKLRKHGFSVLIDDDFEGGTFSIDQMENGVVSSKHVLAVLTPDYISSDWATFEHVMARTLDPAAKRRKLVPILLKDCRMPLKLSILHYRDLRNDDASEWDRLIQDLM